MLGLIVTMLAGLACGLLSFLTKSAGFFAFSMIILAAVCGALRLYIYEFMTEIIFPVSPVFGLALLHACSGLLSLLMNMLAEDVMMQDPTNETFPCITIIICFAVAFVSGYYFLRHPYKLNRSDYDYGRRSTMVSSYQQPGSKKNSSNIQDNGALDSSFNADSINKLLDQHQNMGSINNY